MDDDKEELASLKSFLEDYDKSRLTSIKHILRDTDFDVSTATDAATALDICRKENPHICLIRVVVKEPYSYLSLQNEEGLNLIIEIKEINPKTKCIAYVSCNPTRQLYFLLKEFGADDVIRKPAKPLFVAGKLNVMVWEYFLNKQETSDRPEKGLA